MLTFKHAGRHETKLLLLICWSVHVVVWSRVGKRAHSVLKTGCRCFFCSDVCLGLILLFTVMTCFWESPRIYSMLFTGFYKHMCMTACTQSPPPLLFPVKHELGKVPALFFLKSWWQVTKLFWPFLVCNWFKDHVLCLLKEIWKSFELDPGGFFANRWTEEEFTLV